MENASKALLIAGSVLVAILLIAIGVRVLNSTQGTTEAAQGTMQTTEIAMFNNKFTQYIGKNKTYAQVRSLLDLISASNSTSDKTISVKLRNTVTGNTYVLPNDSKKINDNLAKLTSCSFEILTTTDSYDSKGFLQKITIIYYN